MLKETEIDANPEKIHLLEFLSSYDKLSEMPAI